MSFVGSSNLIVLQVYKLHEYNADYETDLMEAITGLYS